MFPSLDWPSQVPWTYVSPTVQWLSVLFRTLALVVAAPMVFFTALDVVAYLIARTVGAGSPHRHAHLVAISRDDHDRPYPTIIVSSPTTTSKAIQPSTLSNALSSLQRPAHMHHPDQLPTPPSSEETSLSTPTEPKFPTHFTSPSEGNFALAGEGVFSPPESRSSSPPLDKVYKTRKRAASVGVEALGTITDSEDAETETASTSSASSAGDVSPSTLSPPNKGPLRRRRKPGLQFTPLAE